MVGPDIGYHMVGGIDRKLGEVVQLPGLAGLYADPCIGVRRAVMRLVARVSASPAGRLAPLVTSARALVLVPCPFPVPAFYRLQFFFIRGGALLFLGGLVVLGPSYRRFFLSMALIWRILCKWASRSFAGTLSSRLSIEAFAFTGAESMAWVCPLTIPFSTHMVSILVNTSSNMVSGNNWRVLLMVLCQGSSSSIS